MLYNSEGCPSGIVRQFGGYILFVLRPTTRQVRPGRRVEAHTRLAKSKNTISSVGIPPMGAPQTPGKQNSKQFGGYILECQVKSVYIEEE